jgi:hypothetical protein
VLAGLLALAALPAAIWVSQQREEVKLTTAVGAAAGAAFVLGLAAIALARRARFRVETTLGRVGGRRMARLGKALGVLGVCVGLTAALALAFFGLLLYFE